MIEIIVLTEVDAPGDAPKSAANVPSAVVIASVPNSNLPLPF